MRVQEHTCHGHCPLGHALPFTTLGDMCGQGLPQGTPSGPEGRETGSCCLRCQSIDWSHVSVTTVEQTFGHTGAVVLTQFVSRSTETDVRTIWKLSAEMFTSAVSIATAAGGQTHCKETRTKTTTWFDFIFDSTFMLQPTLLLPLLQLYPWKRGGHLQKYVLTWRVQVAPFLQGDERHWSTAMRSSKVKHLTLKGDVCYMNLKNPEVRHIAVPVYVLQKASWKRRETN